jgi:hypothetical protein
MEPEHEVLEQEGLEQEEPKLETLEEEAQQHRPGVLLFNNRIPALKYILYAGLISLIPSLAIAGILAFSGVITEESGPQFEGPVVVLLISMTIVAPVIETLLMGPVLWVLSFITKRKLLLALLSAIVWAVLHSFAAPVWGLVIFWPWFVFSCSYLAWREKGWWRAVFVTIGVHVFQNTLPAIVAVSSQ